MGWLLFMIVAGFVFFLVVTAKSDGLARGANYRQVKPLSDVEQVLYWRLVEALPECVVLSQVTFSRFMRSDVKPWRRDYLALQARIAQKSIDYLVCLKDFTVVAAVELDDGSHVAARDRRRDELLQSAGIAILRAHVRNLPSVDEIRTAFTT